MRFTELDIEELCYRESVLRAGKQYLQKNRIKKLEKKSINSAEMYIQAKVKGKQLYNVTVWLEDGNISQSLCDCPAFHKYPGICKHIAAVLFSCVPEGVSESVSNREETSPEMAEIIKHYQSRENTAAVDMSTQEKMVLEPQLAMQSGGFLGLQLKVGQQRRYIIKDVREFIKNVDDCQYAAYGKNFGFLHTEKIFDKRSARLVSLVRNAVYENELFNKTYNKYSYLSELKTRMLTLTPSALDELTEIYAGEELELKTEIGETLSVQIVEENPFLPVRIKAQENGDGAVVSVEGVNVFVGRKHCYVYKNNKLYRCDEAYTSAMSSFLTELDKYGKSYSVSREDMIAFCGSVLPRLSEFSDIETDGLDLDQYALPEAAVKFYIDVEGINRVMCRAKCSYGDIDVDLFDDADGRGSYRNIGMENNVKMCLMRYFEYNNEGVMEIRDDEDAVFRFADTGLDELRSFGEVYVSDGFERLRVLAPPKIAVGISLSGGQLRLELNSGDIAARELARVMKSYRQRRRYHRLSDGSFLRLEDNALASVAEAVGEFGELTDEGEAGVITMPKYRALYVDSVLKGNAEVKRAADFRAMIRGIKSAEDSDFELPKGLAGKLRGFQKTGFRWLKTIDSYGLCGILADEMGLGKTIQIIALMLSEKEEKGRGISLIVCPASLVYNWESEINRFAPSMKVRVVSGTPEERQAAIDECEDYDVLVTSYDLLKRDVELYESIDFRFEIIDEAQYIKNYFTQSAKAVKAINSRTRFALTGTPIENRLSELWSIFDYLMPGFLYDYAKFRKLYEAPIVREEDSDALGRMKRLIAPFILRRLKADVLHELPEKLETVIVSKMTAEQEKIYYAHVKEVKDSLKESRRQELGRDAIKILAELTRLRQVCCDPSLVYENYFGGSAKLETCMDIVRETVESGHKVLIFSQFTSMLEIIEKRLREEKMEFYTLTGATSKEKRKSLVNSFQTGRTPIFLISLKAGGTGLNLTAADTVIHYDPWWNTAAQEQATDRVHRIGQKKAVTVYKMIVRGTIEENILRLQENKRNLADSVINEDRAFSEKLTKDDILEILDGSRE